MAASTSILTLRTKRLVLRPTAPLDLDAFHLLQLDGTRSKFGRQAPSSARDSKDRLVRLLARQADGELVSWSLAEGPGDPMIGFVGLVRIAEAHRRCEVSYQIRSDHSGKGLVTEALVAVVDHAFGLLGLHRLEGHTDPTNLKSIRVLERSGFTLEGVLRENYSLEGVFYDSAVYGRLATDPSVKT